MAKKSKYYDELPSDEETEATEGMDVTPAPADPANEPQPSTVGPHHLGGAYVGDTPVPVGSNTPGVHPPSIVGTSHAVPIEGPEAEALDGDEQ